MSPSQVTTAFGPGRLMTSFFAVDCVDFKSRATAEADR